MWVSPSWGLFRCYCCYWRVLVLVVTTMMLLSLLPSIFVDAKGVFSEPHHAFQQRRRPIIPFRTMSRNHTSSLSSTARQIQTVQNRKTRVAAPADVMKDVDALAKHNKNNNNNKNKLWPPWPFNLIGRKSSAFLGDDDDGDSIVHDDGYPSTGSLFWAYLRQRSRVGIRQIQQRTFLFVIRR
jgi:hypothetical protein